MTTLHEPLLFETYLRPQIWGGDGLARHLGKPVPPQAQIGEAWELSTLPEHISRVSTGPTAGLTLDKLWSQSGQALSGHEANGTEFPWLVKWLDCAGGLSLQVHPDDDMARAVLGQPHGKSEAWVIVHAEQDAQIGVGLRPRVTRARLESALADGTISECLHTFQPRVGDCLALPAGTIHTACGVIVAEVQQPSDATFRLFDWNRLDTSGQPRALHRELGLKAVNWSQGPINPLVPQPLPPSSASATSELLLSSSWVQLERHSIGQAWLSPYAGEMTVWMVLAGNAELFDQACGTRYKLPRGSTVLIPAAAGRMEWSSSSIGPVCTLLCVREPVSQ